MPVDQGVIKTDMETFCTERIHIFADLPARLTVNHIGFNRCIIFQISKRRPKCRHVRSIRLPDRIIQKPSPFIRTSVIFFINKACCSLRSCICRRCIHHINRYLLTIDTPSAVNYREIFRTASSTQKLSKIRCLIIRNRKRCSIFMKSCLDRASIFTIRCSRMA